MTIGKLGKLPAKGDGRTLRLESYLAADVLERVPAAVDWQDGLNSWDADPLGNADWGDCALADPGHGITLASKLAGLPSPVTAAGVLAAYSELTGFDPAKPETDRGAYMLDVMKYWRNVGICGVKIEAFVNVAVEHIDAAVALFGGVHLGFRLPSSINGQDIWDDVGDSNIIGGHAVFQFAHSPGMGVVNTWGLRQAFTPAFRARYCDEAYAVLLADRPAPSGLDLARLRSDLAKLS
jgi:hypothetical protein